MPRLFTGMAAAAAAAARTVLDVFPLVMPEAELGPSWQRRLIHNRISPGCRTAVGGGPHQHAREKARHLRQAARALAKKERT